MKRTLKILMTSLFLAASFGSAQVFAAYQGALPAFQKTQKSLEFQKFDSRPAWLNQYSQKGSGVRSRNEVMRQVKRQYNAEVLKITYNAEKQIYRVRVLMPNGKVRVLRISARR